VNSRYLMVEKENHMTERDMKFFKVIACEVAWREIGMCAARSPHMIDFEFLPVGNHDNPKLGHADLQARIDAIPDNKYDAVLIGYGICNLILEGIKARHYPLVIPRAHDCITFFLGSKERYQDVFNACPGTYYFTGGWLEFPHRRARSLGKKLDPGEVISQTSMLALEKTYAELVAKYGEDNARYLLEVTEKWTQTYRQGLYIRFAHDEALGVQEEVAGICHERGWELKQVEGDLGLMQRWLCGSWSEQDFLVVQPHDTVVSSHDHWIIKAVKQA
jgi:hypothetical protein